jgi:hypothetical protein
MEPNLPSHPASHRVDILIGGLDDRMIPAPMPTARVDHTVTVSEVRHRIANPARAGFGFGFGFFAAQAVFRLGLFLVLSALLLILAFRALAALGL